MIKNIYRWIKLNFFIIPIMILNKISIKNKLDIMKDAYSIKKHDFILPLMPHKLLEVLPFVIEDFIGPKEYFKKCSFDSFNTLNSVTLQFLYNVAFEALSGFYTHLILLGAITNVKQIKIKTNIPFQLDLEKDIGKGKLVFITYTPQFSSDSSQQNFDDYFFSEYVDNNLPGEKNIKTLFLISKDPKNYNTEITLNILYSYLPSFFISCPIIEYLLSAFIKYSNYEFDDMILKLHLSIEFIKNSLKNKLKNINIRCKEKDIEKIIHLYSINFLEPGDKITIPFFIVEQLNKIYEKRKYIMHEGGNTNQITKEDAKKSIISTYLFYKYYKNVLHLDPIQN